MNPAVPLCQVFGGYTEGRNWFAWTGKTVYSPVMSSMTGLTCVSCGRDVDAPQSAGVCPRCDDPFAVLQVEYDLKLAAQTLTHDSLKLRASTHWRYHELLPIEHDPVGFAWPIGYTPLFETPRLADWVGVSHLRLKDDSRNPTASFKDRASSVGVIHAMQSGATHIACASTGNAASSLAGFAAMAGMKATIYVPNCAPEPKIAQLLIYGAEVMRVHGSYAEAYDMCTQQCDAKGWYNRNCAINPYVIEGKKTCGLEIAEQTNKTPADWVVVSVGDGCTIAGIGRGLQQMVALGLLDLSPRLLGVQSEHVRPIVDAFNADPLGAANDCAEYNSDSTDIYKIAGNSGGGTIADSINVPIPRNWRKAIKAVHDSAGCYITVSDHEIAEAMKAAGTFAGVFAEPAAAAAVAGAKRAIENGIIAYDEKVIAVITGSGLKDIKSAISIAGSPTDIEPTVS